MSAVDDLVLPDGTPAVMAGVYSLAWPETNATMTSVAFPAELWAVTASRGVFDAHLAAAGFPALPEGTGPTKLGLLDLVHEPLLDAIAAAVGTGPSAIGGLERLGHRYPLHGSAAGIGVLLAHLRVTHGVDRIGVLAGDYEGYAAQAAHHGIDVVTLSADDARRARGQTLFVSTPFAATGEPLDDSFVAELCARNRVIVDVAYHGLAGPRPLPVPASAYALLWSLSKPYGLFWRRVGMLACSEPVDAAYGTRWFKDPERLWQAAHVVRAHAAHDMADRYRWAQTAAVDWLAAQGLPARPASVALLATVARADCTAAQWARVARFERIAGSGVARLTLTPLMERLLAAADL